MSEARSDEARREADVSVVIPAHNEERFIGQCLRSLAGVEAEGGSLEVVVVSNGSSDATGDIAKELGATVLEIAPGTVASVRNRGAAIATGRILAFVDADCTVQPGWLENALARLASPEVVAVGSYPSPPAAGSSWVQRTWALLAGRPPGPPSATAWLPSANLLVRAEAFRRIGGFDEQLTTAEDADLCYRVSRYGKLVYDPSVAVIHYREPRTLRDFYRKEVWHGHGSYDGLRKGRFTLAELPSLAAPVVSLVGYLVLVAALTAGLLGYGWTWSGPALLLAIAVPAAYALRAFLRRGSSLNPLHAFLLYSIYFFARVVAGFLWLGRAVKGAH